MQSLVVLSPDADSAPAASLARRCGATVRALGLRAWRLEGAAPPADLADWCREHRVDHAFVPADRRLADLRLLAMDMDSTLITIECIDELGACAGRKAEIAAITEQAMRGEIDYRESIRRRVALLEGLEEAALDEVYDERLRLSPGAEALLSECRRRGIATLLVSGGFSYFTERLRERLGLDDTLANVLDIEGGRLTGRILGPIVDAAAKAARFRQALQRLGAARAQTLAIGDGANDLLMFAEAGVSVGYHPKPLIRSRVSHVLDFAGLDGVLHLYS